jgi:hypothetical protein
VVRKVFNVSSNGFLEVQWYLFAASFLLAAGYTLLQGEHVKSTWFQPLFQAHPDLDRRVRLLVFLTPCAWPCCGTACPSSPALCVGRNVQQRRRPDPLAGI